MAYEHDNDEDEKLLCSYMKGYIVIHLYHLTLKCSLQQNYQFDIILHVGEITLKIVDYNNLKNLCSKSVNYSANNGI